MSTFHISGYNLPSFAVKVSLEGKHGFCSKREGQPSINWHLYSKRLSFILFVKQFRIDNILEELGGRDIAIL